MRVPFRFTIPDDVPFMALDVDECQRRLSAPSLSMASKLSLLRHQADLLMGNKQQVEALACLEKAIAINPADPATLAYQGLAFEQLGQRKQAIATYQSALSYLRDTTSPLGAELWYRWGTVLRHQGRYQQALEKFDRAIAIQTDYAEALSGRALALALKGQHKQAKQANDSALLLAPTSPLILNNSGIVLMAARQYSLALTQFQAVLAQDPDFGKAWYNRGLALMRLGQNEEALDSLNHALVNHPHSPTPPLPHSPSEQDWQASAWTLHALLSLKKRRFQTTLNSCRQVQRLQSDSYSAALYKVTAWIGGGYLWSQMGTAAGRNELGQDVWIILKGLKYRLLGLIGVMGVLIWGQGTAIDVIRQGIPLVLSFGIITLVGLDLWRHKARLRFVWKTYFGSGILTYPRAVLILMVTLFTFTITYEYAPAFMRWGWANAVFGSPGNIIFQPFNLLQDLSQSGPNGPSSFQSGFQASLQSFIGYGPINGLNLITGIIAFGAMFGAMFEAISGAISGAIIDGPTINIHTVPVLALVGTPLFHVGHFHVTVATVLILLFWLALILGVPFWANLEEKIFRQGANTWASIVTRSVQFGLVHLLAGIPILGGLVLIVPGFLFACRYKYVRDRHYRHYHNSQQADAAGVMASTADHAVYNAILMTIAVMTILIEQTTH